MATTTAEAIRDHALFLVEALTPGADVLTRFRRYRNEGDGDFLAWAEANPAACRRRFQIRTSGASVTPAISNTDFEEHQVTLRVLVAYPQTGRDGAAQALDRDDTLDADAFQIDKAIGMLGRANFTSPDACWISGSVRERVEGDGVDFIDLEYTYIYKRAR